MAVLLPLASCGGDQPVGAPPSPVGHYSTDEAAVRVVAQSYDTDQTRQLLKVAAWDLKLIADGTFVLDTPLDELRGTWEQHAYRISLRATHVNGVKPEVGTYNMSCYWVAEDRIVCSKWFLETLVFPLILVRR